MTPEKFKKVCDLLAEEYERVFSMIDKAGGTKDTRMFVMEFLRTFYFVEERIEKFLGEELKRTKGKDLIPPRYSDIFRELENEKHS